MADFISRQWTDGKTRVVAEHLFERLEYAARVAAVCGRVCVEAGK